ncbi:MAG: hypothetical protein AB7U98_05525 [Candidatus Nitrosocosmicus sp.]|uniref:hypothetical protein n=1 Tax=Candidatus Nitrosocosmicus sp. FF01 TaxID=3397670 RepID=UPI0039E919F2
MPGIESYKKEQIIIDDPWYTGQIPKSSPDLEYRQLESKFLYAGHNGQIQMSLKTFPNI